MIARLFRSRAVIGDASFIGRMPRIESRAKSHLAVGMSTEYAPCIVIQLFGARYKRKKQADGRRAGASGRMKGKSQRR